MDSSTKQDWVIKHPTAICCAAVGAHFVALIVLTVASLPTGAENSYAIHGAFSTIIGTVGYLIAFFSERTDYRRLGVTLTFGVWVGSIAPELERQIAGTIGLALFALGAWASEHSRRIR